MNNTIDDVTAPEHDGPHPMRLRVGIGLYLAALAVLTLTFFAWLHLSWFSGLVLVAVYFAIGFYLNRAVLERLIEWHPIYNTVSNVAGEKLRFFVFWPISYGLLLTNLVIQRVL